MKDKKFKYIDDLVEEYIQLSDEQIEIPFQVNKLTEKLDVFVKDHENEVLKPDDAQQAFKIHMQLKKYAENKHELEEEMREIENQLKDFLKSLNNSKISYEKKDDNKTKITFLFWMEGEELKSNRL